MTVAKLIRLLGEFPPSAIVVCDDTDRGELWVWDTVEAYKSHQVMPRVIDLEGGEDATG